MQSPRIISCSAGLVSPLSSAAPDFSCWDSGWRSSAVDVLLYRLHLLHLRRVVAEFTPRLFDPQHYRRYRDQFPQWRLGYELAYIADSLLGWGDVSLLVLALFIFIIYFFNVTAINAFQVRDPKPMGNEAIMDEDAPPPAYLDRARQLAGGSRTSIGGETSRSTEPPVTEVASIPLDIVPPNRKKKKKSWCLLLKSRPRDRFGCRSTGREEGVYDPTLDLSS